MFRKKNLVGDDDDADAPDTTRTDGRQPPQKRKHTWEDPDEEDGDVTNDNTELQPFGARKASRAGGSAAAASTAVMDDADDDDVPEDHDSADEYDEEYYKGEADRQELALKSEVEREMILGARYEKKQQRLETLKVRKAIRDQKARKGATAASAASAQRSSQRATSERAVGRAQQDKVSKLRELGARRNETEKRKERDREAQLELERSSSSLAPSAAAETPALDRRERSGGADTDADDAYGGGWAGGSTRGDGDDRPASSAARAPAEIEAPAPAKELERIRLTRNKLEKWLNEPFFDKAVQGSFVRIGIGQWHERPVYRVAEVVGIKDGFREYRMGEKVCTKRLVLKMGVDSKPFQMSFISNQNFEPGELDKYERVLKEAGLINKSQSYIEVKVKELVDCKEYQYTDQEINQMVEEQQRALVKKRGSLASRKAKLVGRLEQSQAEGTREEQLRLEEELLKLKESEQLTKQIEEKRDGASFRIKDINMRNLDFQRKVGDLAGARDLKAQAQGTAISTDPFARIVNKPTMYWTVKPKSGDPAVAELEEAPVAAPAPALAVEVPTAVASGNDLLSPGFKELVATPRSAKSEPLPSPMIAAANSAMAAFASVPLSQQKLSSKSSNKEIPELAGKRAEAHNVALDIDIGDVPANPAPRHRPIAAMTASLALNTPSGSAQRPRTTLSVTDYKRRMGIE